MLRDTVERFTPRAASQKRRGGVPSRGRPRPPVRGPPLQAAAASGTRALAHKPAVSAIVEWASERSAGPRRESLVQLAAGGGGACQRRRAGRPHRRQPGSRSRLLEGGVSRPPSAAAPRLGGVHALLEPASGGVPTRTHATARSAAANNLCAGANSLEFPAGATQSRTASRVPDPREPPAPPAPGPEPRRVPAAAAAPSSRPSVIFERGPSAPHLSPPTRSHVRRLVHGQQAAGPGVPRCARVQQSAGCPRCTSRRDPAGLGDTSTPPSRPDPFSLAPRGRELFHRPNPGAPRRTGAALSRDAPEGVSAGSRARCGRHARAARRITPPTAPHCPYQAL